MKKLNILYQDEHYVAVHKPVGLFVHKSVLGGDQDHAMRRLRNQIGQWVYPVHRLDRATSGVLLFAVSSEAAGKMGEQFMERQVEKTYWAVVRGFMEAEGVVERGLKEQPDQDRQEARTRYRTLERIELDIPVGRYPKARYALVELKPETGRRHQLRKHCRHLSHPIVGDTVYGDGVHNRLWRDHLKTRRLMLMARRLQFKHPYTGADLCIEGPLEDHLVTLFESFNWPRD